MATTGTDAGSRTHAERRAAALEVFERFTNGEFDAERAQRAMAKRHGALGTFAFDVVMGDVWSRDELSRRDRSLIVITVLATIGSSEELSLHTDVGLNHGLTRTEIEEILIQVAAYAGFPMAMAASRVVDDRFGDLWSREELSRRDRSIVVISILTVLSRTDELAFHVPAGLNHGLSRTEIEEIMVQMTIYGGIPRAVEGYQAMKRAFGKIDARS